MLRKRVWLSVTICIGCFAFATAVKAVLNFKISKPFEPPPYDSAENAKRKGTWVCHVTIRPRFIQLEGAEIRFREAWIERKQVGHTLVWFPNYIYFLCFRLATGDEVLGKPARYSFALERVDNYFFHTAYGGGPWFFWNRIEGPVLKDRRIYLISEERKRVEGASFIATPER